MSKTLTFIILISLVRQDGFPVVFEESEYALSYFLFQVQPEFFITFLHTHNHYNSSF